MPGAYSVERGQSALKCQVGQKWPGIVLHLLLLRHSGWACSFPGAAPSQSPAQGPGLVMTTVTGPALLSRRPNCYARAVPAKAAGLRAKPALAKPIRPFLRTWAINLDISSLLNHNLFLGFFHLSRCVRLCPSWVSLPGPSHKAP